MTATAQLRLVSATETRARIAPEAQIINLTIESDEKLLLTVVEAAHRLGIGRTLMYELLGTGRIESVHVGRLHKVPVEALTRFVAACQESA
jgi:excisionase family DNA binding protein